MKERFYQYIQNLQDRITDAIETQEGKAKFKEDLWTRPEGGGGRTRILENGEVIERWGKYFCCTRTSPQKYAGLF